MSAIDAMGGGGAAGLQQILQLRRQIIDRSSLLQQVRDPAGTATPAAATPPGGFSDALRSALDGVNQVQQRADSLTEGYERGEVTDIAKVMLARQESGVAFEATLQVRNKLLTAYQDIMRMGI